MSPLLSTSFDVRFAEAELALDVMRPQQRTTLKLPSSDNTFYRIRHFFVQTHSAELDHARLEQCWAYLQDVIDGGNHEEWHYPTIYAFESVLRTYFTLEELQASS